MYTKRTLLNDIENAGIRREGTLLIHSSMKSIGEVEGGADTVLDAFIEYMQKGLLLFPTHTWSEENMKDNVFDPKTEPACVGILPNLFMKREGAIRSMHPSHSVTAIGSRAGEYTMRDSAENYTPCPRNGCFGALYDEDAQILFLGASLKTNTYIHGLEEQMNIPNRIHSEARKVTIVEETGKRREADLFGHYSTCGDVSHNYDKLLTPMLQRGIAREVKIGDAISYVVEVKPMTDWVLGLLKENSHLFDDDAPINE